jgi:hypothetical protein
MFIAGYLAVGLSTFAILSLTRAEADYCRTASSDDLNGIPGLSAFQNYVTQDFGIAPKSNSWEVNEGNMVNTVRGDGGADDGANICVVSDDIVVELDFASLECYSSMVKYDASYSGANGTITATITEGYSVAYAWQVSNTSTYGKSHDFSVTTTVPRPSGGTLSVGNTDSVSFGFSNTLQNTTTVTVSELAAFAVAATIDSGYTCDILLNVTTCSMTASLIVPITFDGWIGFEFHKDVTYTGEDKDNEHTSWQASPSISYDMPDYLLTSNVTLSGSIVSQSSANAVVSCYYTTLGPASSVTSNATLTPTTKT